MPWWQGTISLHPSEYIEMGVVDYLYLGGTVQPEFINLGSIFTDCVKRHADNHAWLCRVGAEGHMGWLLKG